MDDDPIEGTSQLFASLLGDVSEEQWEVYKEQNKQGGFIIDSDSNDASFLTDSRSSSPYADEFIANVELVGEDDADMIHSEGEDDRISYGCDAAVKYVNGKISFSELTDIMENCKTESQPAKKRRIEEESQKKAVSQFEKEEKEYQQEKVKLRKQRRRMNHLPKHLEGLMGAATLNFANGNTEDAIKMCMELIRSAPTAQEPFQTLGLIYEEMGDRHKSFQYYLVAAYLNPSDTDEWIHLAELSVEQDQIHQAISCYNHAIRNEPTNVNYLWERCNLLEQIGDRRRALAGYELILKELSSPEDSQKCVQISREIAQVHHENTDFINAIKVLEMAFTKFPSLVTSEDVNFLLELQLSQKFYKEAIKNCVQHCGTKLYKNGQEVSSIEELENLTEEDFKILDKCYVPEVLPIDLAVKFLICLIQLKAEAAIKPLLESLAAENPEEIGDLFLDVTDALMDCKQHFYAKPLIALLLSKQKFDLPAVWMKYGDCLCALSECDAAAKAYEKVIASAPSYQDARLALAKLHIGAGKVQDAICTLRQEYEDGNEAAILDTEVLYQRCKLLEREERWEEFISAAVLIQFSHCYPLETDEEYNSALTTQTWRRKNDVFKEFRLETNRSFPEFTGKMPSKEELMDIFKKVSMKLFKLKRYNELQHLSLSILTSSLFMKDIQAAKDLKFQALLACFYNHNKNFTYTLAKDMVIKNLNNTKAWNLFCLIVTYSQEIRHNRFCLRLMMKHQDHLALGYFNGHNAMMSGTYKHALGEYMCILKDRPRDSFILFCVGITFIHMACQKFATKRHVLIIQGFSFLNQYLKYKGECQETLYNIGRALHQLGIKDAAVHYYKRALFAPVNIKEGKVEIFDLKQEIAYNLSLIYQASGAADLAYIYLRKYIII